MKQSRGRKMCPIRSKKISDATWKLLARHGYDALTFEAIASEVGCNRATIYRRHSSKVELVTAIMRETLFTYEPQIDENSTPREVLLAIVMTTLNYFDEGRGVAILNVMTLHQNSSEISALLTVLHETVAPYYFKQFQRLAPGMDRDNMTFAMRSLIGAILYHSAIYRTQMSRTAIDGLVDGTITLLTALNGGSIQLSQPPFPHPAQMPSSVHAISSIGSIPPSA